MYLYFLVLVLLTKMREDYSILIYVLTGAIGGIIVYWSTEISKIFNPNKFWTFVLPLLIALFLFIVFALVYLIFKKKFSIEEKKARKENKK